MTAGMRHVDLASHGRPEESTPVCGRFRTDLIAAMDQGNLTQVQCLVDGAGSFLDFDLCLRRWHTYARAYLAVRVDHQPVAAAGLLDELLGERDSLPDELLARVWLGRGIVHEYAEEWDRAQACYEAALTAYTQSRDDLGRAKVLNNQSVLHNKGQSYDEAIKCATASVALLSQRPGDPSWQAHLGVALNELGWALMEIGRLAEAAEAFRRSLTIDELSGSVQGQGICHTNLGHVHRRLGDSGRAEMHYRTAIRLLPGEDDHELAEAQWGLGLVKCSQEGASEKAWRLLDAAFETARAANNHEISTDVHLARADLLERSGNLPASLAENRLAVATVESLRTNIGLLETRIRLHGSRIRAYERMVSRLFDAYKQSGPGLRTSRCAEAFQYAEMAKSRALVEMLASQRSVRMPDRVPAAWLAEENGLRAALLAEYEAVVPDGQRIGSLEQAMDALRRRFRQVDAEFESFQSVAPLTLEEVMARLPESAVLVEYFVAGNDLLAFVVTPATAEFIRLPLRVSQLVRAFEPAGDGTVGRLRHLVPDATGRLRDAWHLEALCRDLVEPLGEAVWNTDLLCVVPHGALHYVPFHAMGLPNGTARRLLAAPRGLPRPIVYAPGATVLFDYCRGKMTRAAESCLAVGFNGKRLARAETEASGVARITGGRSLTGPQATTTALFATAGSYRCLHLACHGQFNPHWPLSSHLSLADGILDVEGVLCSLRLTADLVTLSACETGQSRILQGDELIGLTRAFLYAGTPSVVVSQWHVNDVATSLLMEDFYGRLMAGQDGDVPWAAAAALSQAQHCIQNLSARDLCERLLAYGVIGPAEVERWFTYVAALGGKSTGPLPGDSRPLAHPFWWAAFFVVGDRTAWI